MAPDKPKIIFLGADLSPISLSCLKVLAAENRYELLVGIDQYDKSIGSLVHLNWHRYGLRRTLQRILKQLVARTEIKLRSPGAAPQSGRSLREIAKLSGMQSFQCSRVNGPEVRDIINTFAPDLIVVANFSQIIRTSVRRIPRLGIINFHPSTLPKYRGPTPIYWVLRNGETKSGATVHFIDEGIDTGDIICQQELDILPHDTEATLTRRTIEIGTPLLKNAVESLLADSAKRSAQIESDASCFGFPRSGSRL